jgi:hypothetical protein
MTPLKPPPTIAMRSGADFGTSYEPNRKFNPEADIMACGLVGRVKRGAFPPSMLLEPDLPVGGMTKATVLKIS